MDQATIKESAVVNIGGCSKPVWPAESLAKEHQDTVTLSSLVGTDGQPKDSAVKKSSG